MQIVVAATKSRDGRQIDRSDSLLSGSSASVTNADLFRISPASTIVHPPTGTKTRRTYDFTSK